MFSSLRTLARRTAPALLRATPARAVTRRIASTSSIVSTSNRRFFSNGGLYGDEEGFYSPQQPIIGQPAPHFKATAVVDGEFKEVSLDDYKGKYVILFFYPLDFTFVCPTEIIAFSERIKEFRNINTEILGVSIDSEYSHLAWTKQPRKEGGLDKGFSLRGLFIIDPTGTLRQITVNDTPIGRSVDETLRLVQAFQYHEKHGEVCPANWKPGSDTIKTTAEGAKAYFSKAHK